VAWPLIDLLQGRSGDGIVSSTVLTLGVIPALCALVKQWPLRRAAQAGPPNVD
jgi:hypothetical protein